MTIFIWLAMVNKRGGKYWKIIEIYIIEFNDKYGSTKSK